MPFIRVNPLVLVRTTRPAALVEMELGRAVRRVAPLTPPPVRLPMIRVLVPPAAPSTR